MNTVTASITTLSTTNIVLGLAAAILVIAVWSGFNESVGLGVRGAFWLLFVIGLVMCARGPLGQGATLGWWSPGHIAGYILGAAALLLGAAVLFDLSLPLINGAHAAVLALGLLMAVKVVIAVLYTRPG